MDFAARKTLRAGIALGSNLGDRTANLCSARDLLLKIRSGHHEHEQAPIYCSVPMNCPEGSPDFFNTVVEITFSGSPFQLLKETKAIEDRLGRPPDTPTNSPRIIDLDILYLGEHIIDSGELIIPHPRIIQRRFVLQPLADIRPSMCLPGHGVSIREHLEALNPAEDQLSLVKTDW